MNPISSVDTQHQDLIHDAQLDYYGRRLATASSDRTVKIFYVYAPDPANNPQQQEMVHAADILGHDGPVWEVSWAHPMFGSLLASCGYDRRVIIHKETPPNQWVQLHVDEQQSSVNSIAWSPHEYGLHLACASSDGAFTVLSLQQDDSWAKERVQDNQLGVNAVTWAPYGALGSVDADSGDVRRIATGSCDNNVKIYASRDGEPWTLEHELKKHEDWVRDVAWAPSLGLPYNVLASCSEDGVVILWTQEVEGGEWKDVALPKFDGPVWRLSWSATGNVLAVSSGEASVTLWKETLDRGWVQVRDVGAAGEASAAAAEAGDDTTAAVPAQGAPAAVSSGPAAAGSAERAATTTGTATGTSTSSGGGAAVASGAPAPAPEVEARAVQGTQVSDAYYEDPAGADALDGNADAGLQTQSQGWHAASQVPPEQDQQQQVSGEEQAQFSGDAYPTQSGEYEAAPSQEQYEGYDQQQYEGQQPYDEQQYDQPPYDEQQYDQQAYDDQQYGQQAYDQQQYDQQQYDQQPQQPYEGYDQPYQQQQQHAQQSAPPPSSDWQQQQPPPQGGYYQG